MVSPISPAAIKPTLCMGDGLPFAGGQGQTAGPGTRKFKIYNLRRKPSQTATGTTKAAATTTGVSPKKKKLNRVATEARIAVKEKKRAQSKAPEPVAVAKKR